MKRMVVVLAAVACLVAGATARDAGQWPCLERPAQVWQWVHKALAADADSETADDKLKECDEAERAKRRELLKALAEAKKAAKARAKILEDKKQAMAEKQAENQRIALASGLLLDDLATPERKAEAAPPKSAWTPAGKLRFRVQGKCGTVESLRTVEWNRTTDELRFGDTHEALTNPALIAVIEWRDWRRPK